MVVYSMSFRCFRSVRLAKRLGSASILHPTQNRQQAQLVSVKGLSKHAEDCGVVSRVETPREGRLFPFIEPFVVKNEQWTSRQIIEALQPLTTEARLTKIEAVASARQFDVVPVIECAPLMWHHSQPTSAEVPPIVPMRYLIRLQYEFYEPHGTISSCFAS